MEAADQLMQSLGTSRLIRPLQHRLVKEELKRFAANSKTYEFSISLYEELLHAARGWLGSFFPAVREMPYFYLSGGILEALNFERAISPQTMCMFDGEFNYLQQLDPGRVRVVDLAHSLAPDELLYLSLPSAINGCVELNMGKNSGEQVILDLAYACTVRHDLQLRETFKVKRALFSLSKMLGEPSFRQGFIFSTEPIQVLEFLKEKQYVSVLLAPLYLSLFSKFKIGFLYDELSFFQKRAAQELGVSPSDSVLLSNSTDERFSYWRKGHLNRIYLGKFMFDRYQEVQRDFLLK